MSELIRYGVTRRWSDAVVAGGIAYFVEVPDEVDARLAQVGSDKSRLVQVLVYLPFPGDLALFNRMWDEWIPEGHAPSRACTHPTLAAPGYRVELVLTASVL